MTPGDSGQQPVFSLSSILQSEEQSHGLTALCSPSPQGPNGRLPHPSLSSSIIVAHTLTAHPFSMQQPVPSRDQEGVMEIAGKQWSQHLAKILFLLLIMPHPFIFWYQDLCTQPWVTI